MVTDVEKQIIEAAKRVFLAKGYNETNMGMIAQEAGMARPAIYYYFRGKERIFNAVFDDIVQDFFPSILDILKKESSLHERLENLVEAYVEQLKRNPLLPLFLVKELNRDPGLLIRQAFENPTFNFPQQVLAWYQAAVGRGELKDVPIFCIPFTALGLILTPFLARPAIESLAEGQFDEILDAWKPFVVRQLETLLKP